MTVVWAGWPVVSSEGATGTTDEATGWTCWACWPVAPGEVCRARAWSVERTPVEEPVTSDASRSRPDFSQRTSSLPHCGRSESAGE